PDLDWPDGLRARRAPREAPGRATAAPGHRQPGVSRLRRTGDPRHAEGDAGGSAAVPVLRLRGTAARVPVAVAAAPGTAGARARSLAGFDGDLVPQRHVRLAVARADQRECRDQSE